MFSGSSDFLSAVDPERGINDLFFILGVSVGRVLLEDVPEAGVIWTLVDGFGSDFTLVVSFLIGSFPSCECCLKLDWRRDQYDPWMAYCWSLKCVH